MKIKLILLAAAVALNAAALAGCSGGEETSNTGGVSQNGSQTEGQDNEQVPSDSTEETGYPDMWDVLPEIPVTDSSAFEYKYDSELGGMAVTNYLNESPKIRIPDKLEGEPVVKLDLSECVKELTEVIMPDTVKEISFSPQTGASIKYINHPRDKERVSFNNGRVRAHGEGYIYYDFSMKSLEEVYIPDGAVSIGDLAFVYCENLTRVTIPDSVTKIGERAFSGCTSLTSVTIPNSVTEIGWEAFKGCTGLTSIAIPDSVTIMGENVFWSCDSLTNVTYKGETYSRENHYDYSEFYELYNAVNSKDGMLIENGVLKYVVSYATEITIPDSVTVIGGSAFSGCTGLTSITIPDSVTEIRNNAFYGCTGLTSVTIPDSVTEIGEKAFYECTSLTSFTYKGATYSYDEICDLFDYPTNSGIAEGTTTTPPREPTVTTTPRDPEPTATTTPIYPEPEEPEKTVDDGAAEEDWA